MRTVKFSRTDFENNGGEITYCESYGIKAIVDNIPLDCEIHGDVVTVYDPVTPDAWFGWFIDGLDAIGVPYKQM